MSLESRKDAVDVFEVIADMLITDTLKRHGSAPGVDIAAVVRAAHKQGEAIGIRAGAREGYKQGREAGIAEGAQRAREAMTKSPSVTVIQRDGKGQPVAIVSEFPDGGVETKRLERDASGRIIRLLAASTV
jgi:hypothetical protein